LMQVQMLSPALAIQVLHQVKKEPEQAFALWLNQVGKLLKIDCRSRSYGRELQRKKKNSTPQEAECILKNQEFLLFGNVAYYRGVLKRCCCSCNFRSRRIDSWIVYLQYIAIAVLLCSSYKAVPLFQIGR
jgi:hypothetical protein